MAYSSPLDKRAANADMLNKLEYLQSLYPASMKRLQQYVVEVCDRMDYSGSPIYDEYPDKMVMYQMVNHIFDQLPEAVKGELEWLGQDSKDSGRLDEAEVEVYEAMKAQQVRGGGGRPPSWGPPPGRPPGGPPSWGPPPNRPPGGPPSWGPPSWGRPPSRPPGGTPSWGRPPQRARWLEDILTILLLGEVQRRNCKIGRC